MIAKACNLPIRTDARRAFVPNGPIGLRAWVQIGRLQAFAIITKFLS